MKLSPRRFPDTVMRRRQSAGQFVVGEYVEGATVETELRASVQPVRLEDDDTEGGAQFLERLRIYVPMEGALRAAFEDSVADEVVIDGKVYVVERSESWRASHTRADVVRSAVTI